MRLTKFVHSCLLAETADAAILFDPGQFSWESGLVDMQELPTLDTVVITHEHADHFSQDFVRAILKKFPETSFITTESIAKTLQEMGVKHVSTESRENISIFSKKTHASLEPLGVAPQNIAVHFADTLTVGGDRHDLEESKQVLALPVTAPWGSMMAAASMALRLRPKTIIPIHDWHWNDKARKIAYDTLQTFFDRSGIRFVTVTDGEPVDV